MIDYRGYKHGFKELNQTAKMDLLLPEKVKPKLGFGFELNWPGLGLDREENGSGQ